MRYLLLLTFFFLTISFAKATSVVDSVHVKHYNITLDTIKYSNSFLYGHTALTVESKVNGLTSINLSLLGMVVDSVLSGSTSLTYSHVSPSLKINLTTALNIGDSINFQVYYHGKPQADPVFGGFTFAGNYAFNLGVGLQTKPHNLGKSWFPCVDEFTDRATYEFHVRTPKNYKAFCNGELTSEVTNADLTKTYSWNLDKTIPTYLASVAVAPFYTINKSYKGIPIQWGVMAADSAKTKITFAKIDSALSIFINAYGPYPWNKVGYVSVPFNGGAMEHATSIHIGSVFVDGTLTYETMWAHELSHMWWGDKVTCASAEEMWLNEGFATFNEFLFTDKVYGRKAYKDAVRQNHRKVLQFAHIIDKGYHPLNNVPQDYTYSNTVYQKGGDIIHTLKNFIGEDKFFLGAQYYMSRLAYKNATSDSLSLALTQSSGINTTRFFDDWIKTPGFMHFSIDSTIIQPVGGNFKVKVYTRQIHKGGTHIYSMPVECSLTDGAKDTTVTLTIDAKNNQFDIVLPFSPTYISLDRNEKISDAIVDYENHVDSVGTLTFPETGMSVNVTNKGTGNSIMRVEHHFVEPDPIKNTALKLKISDSHYWKVDGIFGNGLVSKGIFSYDGTNSNTTGYLDNNLINLKEDSLVLLYRKGPSEDWSVAKNAKLNTLISNTDKKGNITVDSLKKGEYAFAYGYKYTGLNEKTFKKSHSLQIYPNPINKSESCLIKISSSAESNKRLEIVNELGQEVYSYKLGANQESLIWQPGNVAPGIYFVNLKVGNIIEETQKLILN